MASLNGGSLFCPETASKEFLSLLRPSPAPTAVCVLPGVPCDVMRLEPEFDTYHGMDKRENFSPVHKTLTGITLRERCAMWWERRAQANFSRRGLQAVFLKRFQLGSYPSTLSAWLNGIKNPAPNDPPWMTQKARIVN